MESHWKQCRNVQAELIYFILFTSTVVKYNPQIFLKTVICICIQAAPSSGDAFLLVYDQ